MGPQKVVMLLSNPFRPDPRVRREARSLVQAGYNVTVVCWDRQGELVAREEIDGVEIRRMAIPSRYSAGSRQMFYLPRFWRCALQELYVLRPSIVHCHDLDTTPAGYWYARRHHVPWIFDAHECYPEQIGPQVNRVIYYALLILERYMTRRATHVITVGELLAQRFRSMGGQVSVVGNYQHLEPLGAQHHILRADLGLRPSEFVVSYIGGFTRARAILPLIQATEHFSDVTVLLLGDGPQRGAIESQLPSHPHVRYLGHVPQDQVPDYTAMADVIYYGLDIHDGNSRYSSPNALFHALVAGKPVLTTNVGEIADIVREEQCGVVVELPTPVLLAQAMRQLSDPDIRGPLAANAYRAARSRYNWAVAEATLLNVYQGIITGDG